MNNTEDIKLRFLLQDVKLDSPDKNFSTRVLNKIRLENEAIEKIKSDKIFGKAFWVILVLFIILLGVIWVLSSSGIQTSGFFDNILNESVGITEYQSFLEKLGSVPVGVAVILIATTILLFVDRIFSSRLRVFTEGKIA